MFGENTMNWKATYEKIKEWDSVEIIPEFANIGRKQGTNGQWHTTFTTGGIVTKVFEDGTFKLKDCWPIYNPKAFKKVLQ